MAKRKPLPKRRPVKKGFHDTSADKVFGLGAVIAIGLALFAAVQTPATQASVAQPDFVSREVVLTHEPDDAPVLQGDQADGVAAFEKARKELKRKKVDAVVTPPKLVSGLTDKEQAAMAEISKFKQQYAQAEEAGDWAGVLGAAHKINPKAFKGKKGK